jgi:hypothetical protein
MALFAPPVTPPTALFAPPVTPPTVFFAPLTWLAPGYLLAATGFGPADFAAPVVVGLFDAGVEFERLTTGLRAVEGRALGEGWYVWPVMAVL